MDLDRFLNLLASVFGALGSVYVLKGIAGLSPDLIERLSRSYWGFSAAQIDSLTAQKADAIVGIALVLIALVISIVNQALVPPVIRVFESWAMGIALVAVLAGAAYLALAFSGAAVQRHQRLAVGRLITTQEISALLEAGKLPSSEVDSLKAYGRTLLGLAIDDSEVPRALFMRIANEVGLAVPETFDFSEVEEVKKGQ
jgi:hypothetical protein